MKSLLEKVHSVEKEAAAVVHQAEQTGRQAVAELLDHEREVMVETRSQAEKKAQQLIEQKVAQAKAQQAQEANTTAVPDIQNKAAAQRSVTVQYAEELLLNTYKS